jgi:hypothetical protein
MGTPAQRGTVERIKVHGTALEGNLEGDSPDRFVSVYLPPSYGKERNRRYPAIYLLHGFTDDDHHWFGRIRHFIDVPAVVDKALAAGGTRLKPTKAITPAVSPCAWRIEFFRFSPTTLRSEKMPNAELFARDTKWRLRGVTF